MFDVRCQNCIVFKHSGVRGLKREGCESKRPIPNYPPPISSCSPTPTPGATAITTSPAHHTPVAHSASHTFTLVSPRNSFFALTPFLLHTTLLLRRERWRQDSFSSLALYLCLSCYLSLSLSPSFLGRFQPGHLAGVFAEETKRAHSNSLASTTK